MPTCVDHRVPHGGIPTWRGYRLDLLCALEEFFFPQVEKNINAGHPKSHIIEGKSARIWQQSYPLSDSSESSGRRRRRSRTHRVHSIFHTKLALWVDSMIADDVPHAGDDQDLTVWRATEEVCQIHEELLSERIDGNFVNFAILDCGVRSVDEWPHLQAGSQQSRPKYGNRTHQDNDSRSIHFEFGNELMPWLELQVRV